MRNIYEQVIKETQQGCIFNGAISEYATKHRAFGLIVTPRCDIAQKKVSTIHYVPIISLEDWKRKILTPLSQSDRLEKKRNELLPLMKKYQVPQHIADTKYKLSDDDLATVIPDKKIFQKVAGPLKDCWNLQDLNYCYDNIKQWSKYQSKLNDLIHGRNERFLLLERWNDDTRFYVICLTEIYHITISTALKLKEGILVRDINFEENDLSKSESMRNEYKIVAQLSSPYIEYVTQHLSNAFFRIGIDDWEDSKSMLSKI